MSASEWTLDLEAQSHPRCLRLEEAFSVHNRDHYCSIFTVLKADIELLGHMRASEQSEKDCFVCAGAHYALTLLGLIPLKMTKNMFLYQVHHAQGDLDLS
jgi:hypothetical protein